MKGLSIIFKGIDKISISLGKLFSITTLIIMVLQVAEIVLRYIFKFPTIWIWELCVYLYGTAFIMAGAWALQEDLHVRTDLLITNLNKRQHAFLNMIMYPLLAFVFIFVMTPAQISAAIHSFLIRETSFNAWGPPVYHFKAIIALGFVIFGLQAFANWIRSIFMVFKGVEI